MRRRFLPSVFYLAIALASCTPPKKTAETVAASSQLYYSLHHADDLDPLVAEVGDARIVLLGESTHGTKEYYQWRTYITQRLVAEKKFTLVAIEGDWADASTVDAFILGPRLPRDSAAGALRAFNRWPSTMWGNREMIPLIDWLNEYNQNKAPAQKCRFYGLDLYSFWEFSRQAVTTDSSIQHAIRSLSDFFSDYDHDAMLYGQAVRKGGPRGTDRVTRLFKLVQNSWNAERSHTESSFNIYQQAWLAKNGEEFFRTMHEDRVRSVNLRDTHMASTIERLLEFHGKESRIVVWLHNGHAGDEKYTASGSAGYTSVSSILRNRLGEKYVFSVGFGTYQGTVLAAYQWNGEMIEQRVPPAKQGSWEEKLHQLNAGDMLLLSRNLVHHANYNRWIEMRSIGAAYSGAALYNASIIPKRFNAFIYIDSTSATRPL